MWVEDFCTLFWMASQHSYFWGLISIWIPVLRNLSLVTYQCSCFLISQYQPCHWKCSCCSLYYSFIWHSCGRILFYKTSASFLFHETCLAEVFQRNSLCSHMHTILLLPVTGNTMEFLCHSVVLVRLKTVWAGFLNKLALYFPVPGDRNNITVCRFC